MQQFARAELSKRTFFTLKQTCKKLACYIKLKKTGKEEENQLQNKNQLHITHIEYL